MTKFNYPFTQLTSHSMTLNLQRVIKFSKKEFILNIITIIKNQTKSLQNSM